MSLFNWFKQKKKLFKVVKVSSKSSKLQDSAMAIAFAEAGEHETARRIVEKKQEPVTRKILAVAREDNFSTSLIEYSLNMANKLNAELVALNVTRIPLSLHGNAKEEMSKIFHDNSTKNIENFTESAKNSGVMLTHLVEIGVPDDVVENIYTKHSGIQYVLTEPDPEVTKQSDGKVAIPVFNLAHTHA